MTEEEKKSEEEIPLTREDVLKLIEEHGGPEGLDLSGRNLEGINLSGKSSGLLDLHGINLIGANLQKADLWNANMLKAELAGANLQEADLSYTKLQKAILTSANLQEANLSFAQLQEAILWHANLQEAILFNANLQEANLSNANLQKARLFNANLHKANLFDANLQEADLTSADLQKADLQYTNLVKTILGLAKITYDTRLEYIKWGQKYILGDEELGEFETAENVYRTLKQWHTQAGMYPIADQFHYREWAVARKGIRWREHFWQKLWNWVFYILCGYGGRPGRVILWAAVIILGLAGIYSASTLSFPDSLYHSAVSFTALGYGLGATNPGGWVKGLGAFEAFIGVFMMALFLITFVRKMVR